MKRSITTLVLLSMIGGCGTTAPAPLPPETKDAGAPTALAMRFGDWTLPPADGSNQRFESFEMLIPPDLDPDTLVLFFSDSVQACDRPMIAPPTKQVVCGGSEFSWQLILLIPPELDRPGVVDLRDRRILNVELLWKPVCGTYNGGASEGWNEGGMSTIEIVESNADSVSVKLRMGHHPPPWANVDGDYTATRCGEAPPELPPMPAVAIHGTELATAPDGTTPEPDALYLSFGTGLETCASPYDTTDCTFRQRWALSLPPSLQKPGVIDLFDPAIDGFLRTGCDIPFDAATFAQGTIEILSIDATDVSFRIFGTSPDGAIIADGLYAAPLCP